MALFDDALKAEGITGTLADLARSIYTQESGGGKNTKTSNAGAMGGMQVIPSTFNSVADKGWDMKDPMHNARAGIRYLGQMYKLSGGDPALAAAGYYGGPGGLAKARQGVAVADPRNPNAPTTLEYGKQVASRLGKGLPVDQAQLAAPVQVAPIQLAQASPKVPEVQAQAPRVFTDEELGWNQFKKVMPEPVQAEDINYLSRVQMPQMQMAAMNTPQVNFNAFTGWRGRA